MFFETYILKVANENPSMKNFVKDILHLINTTVSKYQKGKYIGPLFYWKDAQKNCECNTDKEKLSITSHCVFCTGCVVVCSADAIIVKSRRIEILQDRCIYCKACLIFCPVNGISGLS
jgi:Fe-S-cluster-containing hydrogenase component 2